jgi:hypothetical protein
MLSGDFERKRERSGLEVIKEGDIYRKERAHVRKWSIEILC